MGREVPTAASGAAPFAIDLRCLRRTHPYAPAPAFVAVCASVLHSHMWGRMKALAHQGERNYAGFLDLYDWFHAEGARLKKLVTKAPPPNP